MKSRSNSCTRFNPPLAAPTIEIVDRALRKDQLVGPAVIGDHLAAVSAEAREIRVIGADNGVELRLRLPEAGFEASSGQRLPVEARVLLDPKAPVIEGERHG